MASLNNRLGTQALTTESAMAAAIQQVLAQESLKNERSLAYIRTIVLAISSVLDILVFFFPQTLLGQPTVSPTIALVSLSACLTSMGFLILLLQPHAWRKLHPITGGHSPL
jgi:hypothetical protein